MHPLVSPTDQDLCNLLDGISSSLPEQYGADVLVFANGISVAWQRKTIGYQLSGEGYDLLASIEDGRLARELPLLRDKAKISLLIVEGTPIFDSNGNICINGRSRRQWTRQSYKNLLRSVHYQFGVRVEETTCLSDTADAIRGLLGWLGKEHSSLLVRPKELNQWGAPLRGEGLNSHILQGFPGIGPKTAQAILEHFKGLPLAWTCTEKELQEVKGIGKLTAERLIELLK